MRACPPQSRCVNRLKAVPTLVKVLVAEKDQIRVGVFTSKKALAESGLRQENVYCWTDTTLREIFECVMQRQPLVESRSDSIAVFRHVFPGADCCPGEHVIGKIRCAGPLSRDDRITLGEMEEEGNNFRLGDLLVLGVEQRAS